MLPARLRRCPPAPGRPGVRVAASFRARLLGLALLREPPPVALLLPRTRGVHTFGMRFAVDLVWLDEAGEAVRLDREVPPRRMRWCGRAAAVMEVPVHRPRHARRRG